MKFRCINNQDVETLVTVGKVYAGQEIKGLLDAVIGIRVYRCDDKHEGYFSPSRFEPAEELVAPEPKTFIYTYALETK